MTIWILALLLLAVGAGMGLGQGAIRVAISFVGIVLSALLAWPLSGLIRSHIGIHNPFVAELVAPVLVFLILLGLIKLLGQWAHHKATVYYKYKTDDVQRILWERLNRRVGLSLGMLNGLAYFVLISLVIYNLSYWSVQVAPSKQERLPVRILNRLGWGLQDTGLIRAARAIDPMPKIYFTAADVAGLIYQNPELRDRLSAYPAFLSLDERDDFKQLGLSAAFQNAWKSQAPLGQLWDDPQVKTIRNNADTAALVWNLVLTNLDDLQTYLETGKSAKYGAEPILGRWDFDVMRSLMATVITRTNVPSGEMAALRTLWSQAYAKTVFIAGADGQAFLKDFPQFNVPPNQPTTFDTATWQGRWEREGNHYAVTLTSNGASKSGAATIDASRLTIKTESDTLIFGRQE